MGKRGPKPEPTQLRILRGRDTPDTSDEPKVPDGTLKPPSWLSGVALEKWNEMVPLLTRMKVLTIAERDLLARYCAMHAEFVKYYEFVQSGGDVLVVRDQRGTVKYMQQTPQAVAMKQTAAMLLQIEREFGMTPSARSQINMTAAAVQADPLQAFISKRGSA